MKRTVIDIETRSCCDLRATGGYVYATHTSTEILCIAWCVDKEPMKSWRFDTGGPNTIEECNADLQDAIIVAHNYEFELSVMTGPAGKRIGLVVPTDLDVWSCTAARSAALGLPRALGNVGAALNLPVQKDDAGHRLMMQVSRPKPKTGFGGVPPVYFDDADRITRLVEYCITDTEVERLLDQKLPELSDTEREVWQITGRMNEHGVGVDDALVLRLAFLIEDATRALNSRIQESTKGAVPAVTNHEALVRWLQAEGIPAESVAKAAVTEMLANPDIDPVVREVLVYRQEGGKSSAAKYRSLIHRMSNDGRIRGALVYCGAASTGRWSSRGVQLQNLPHGASAYDAEEAVADIMADTPLEVLEAFYAPGLVLASQLLRSCFLAKD